MRSCPLTSLALDQALIILSWRRRKRNFFLSLQHFSQRGVDFKNYRLGKGLAAGSV